MYRGDPRLGLSDSSGHFVSPRFQSGRRWREAWAESAVSDPMDGPGRWLGCRPVKRETSAVWLLVVSALALKLLLPSQTLAVQTTLPDCDSSCELRFERVAVLGETTGPGYVGRPVGLVQRADGLYALIDRADQDRVKFYESDGQYLRSFGRRGQGPGEFQTTNHLFLLDGDSVMVHDLGSRRFTVISPDFSVGRVTPPVDFMPGRLVHVPDGSWIANARVFSPSGIGLPLHWLDEDGTVIRSFGADPPIEDLTDSAKIRRRLATSTTRSVWAVHQPRYLMEEWSRDGSQLRNIERAPSWFPPHEGGVTAPDGSPLPYVRVFHQDRNGLLWTVVWVPADDWRDGLAAGEGPQGQPGAVVSDYSRLYDTVIEVIDPDAGRVIRSQRFDVPFWGFVEDGRAYALENVNDGADVRISVWEIEFGPAPDSDR